MWWLHEGKCDVHGKPVDRDDRNASVSVCYVDQSDRLVRDNPYAWFSHLSNFPTWLVNQHLVTVIVRFPIHLELKWFLKNWIKRNHAAYNNEVTAPYTLNPMQTIEEITMVSIASKLLEGITLHRLSNTPKRCKHEKKSRFLSCYDLRWINSHFGANLRTLAYLP